MNQEQWDRLQAGSIIRNIKSKRLRKVLKYNANTKSITLCKVSGRGTTVYCNGDKYLLEPTGFKIKIMDTEKFKKARGIIEAIESIEKHLRSIEFLLKSYPVTIIITKEANHGCRTPAVSYSSSNKESVEKLLREDYDRLVRERDELKFRFQEI